MTSWTKDSCYHDLKARILRLDLPPGTAVEESKLSGEYGLSRTPLREVFHRLAGEGFLDLAANRGATVSSMDLETMRNFFQTAPLIYATITRLAAENATPAQISDLKRVQCAFRGAVKERNASGMVTHNHRFHEVIGDMAGNVYLLPSLQRLLIDHARMGQTFYRPRQKASEQRIETACDQHDQMIEAIETRNPGLAVELTLQHWELSRDEIEKYARPDPLPIHISRESMEASRDAV